MKKPFKYFAINNKTKEIKQLLEYAGQPHITCLDLTLWTIYEDTRYQAKIRLYNYIYKIVKKSYRPFEGTEIGKSLPILNF